MRTWESTIIRIRSGRRNLEGGQEGTRSSKIPDDRKEGNPLNDGRAPVIEPLKGPLLWGNVYSNTSLGWNNLLTWIQGNKNQGR